MWAVTLAVWPCIFLLECVFLRQGLHHVSLASVQWSACLSVQELGSITSPSSNPLHNGFTMNFNYLLVNLYFLVILHLSLMIFLSRLHAKTGCLVDFFFNELEAKSLSYVSSWPQIYCLAKDDLELVIFLLPPPRCWDYRYAPPSSG